MVETVEANNAYQAVLGNFFLKSSFGGREEGDKYILLIHTSAV